MPTVDTEIGVLVQVSEGMQQLDLPQGRYAVVVQAGDATFTVDADGVVGGDPHQVERQLIASDRPHTLAEIAAIGLARLARRAVVQRAKGETLMPGFTEMGHAIEWGWIQVGRNQSIGFSISVNEVEVIRCLHADAWCELPHRTRYEIRKRAPENFGRTRGMAWYHASTFDQVENWGAAAPGWQPQGGYYLVGQFITPDASLETPETHYKIGTTQ